MNECKIMIAESSKNKKNKEYIIFKKTLYDNLITKVMTMNFDDEIREKMKEWITNLPKPKKNIYNYIPWYSTHKTSKEIVDSAYTKIYNFDDLQKSNNVDDYFIDTAITYLNNNNITIKREGQIEYKSYNLLNNDNDPIFFDVYKDSEILGYNTSTCIFINQSNENVFGNIDTYIIEPGSPKTPTKFANIIEVPNNIIKKEIKICKEQIILMTGNVMYCPQPLYGNGNRSYVIVRLRN